MSVSSVSRDWARVIFGSPSLFENMVDFTERLLGHIRIALVQKDGRNMITFLSLQYEDMLRRVYRCVRTVRSSTSGAYIKDSRCRSLLNLMKHGWTLYHARALYFKAHRINGQITCTCLKDTPRCKALLSLT